MKVLLAEDDPGVRESLVDLLSDRAEIVAVASTPEALRQLSERRFELVMTDLSLPGGQMGGWEIAREARSRLMPVVIASGSARELPRAGMPFALQGTLDKPFSVERIFALLDRFEALEREARACAAKSAGGTCERHELAAGAPLELGGSGAGLVLQSGRLVNDGRALVAGDFGFFTAEEPARWQAESPVRLVSVTAR